MEKASHGRNITGTVLLVMVAVLLSAPLVLVLSKPPLPPASVTLVKLTALEAFTLISVNVVTGALSHRRTGLFQPERSGDSI